MEVPGTSTINTQYMRNPDMVYVLKMKYVSKINIFGLNMMVKSGLEKIFLKFLHARGLFQVCPVSRLSLGLLNWDSQQGRSDKGKFHPYSILST